MKCLDLIIQFAMLWGMEIASPTIITAEQVNDLRCWESSELQQLFIHWAGAYNKQTEFDDSVDFFHVKLKELLRNDARKDSI
jgi:hypothetical protein